MTKYQHMRFSFNKCMPTSWADPKGSVPPPPPGNHVVIGSLKILVRTPLEKPLDPLGPSASQGRFVRIRSVKSVDD